MKYYYAINYPLGLATHANTGKRYGAYHKFESKAQRDKYVSDGPTYRSGRNYRETIASSDSELRTELRNEPFEGAFIIIGE